MTLQERANRAVLQPACLLVLARQPSCTVLQDLLAHRPGKNARVKHSSRHTNCVRWLPHLAHMP
jgi:hypothetical protein